MELSVPKMVWTREPEEYEISDGRIEIVTQPGTDLWQRTYYHFRNDNAPVLQAQTREQYFSFIVKTDFREAHHRFDQCGIAVYLDSDNWLKASVEYEDGKIEYLGSVVTNHGYSDWGTFPIDPSIRQVWYRLSRRGSDFRVEASFDGSTYLTIRVCHLWEGAGEIRFGVYACSPEDSSFRAVFTDMALTECAWMAHDGQQPDEEEL